MLVTFFSLISRTSYTVHVVQALRKVLSGHLGKVDFPFSYSLKGQAKASHLNMIMQNKTSKQLQTNK